MEEKEIKVLAKLNENSEITQIGSSIFITDDTFIEVDSGLGDKFAHAQNLYLEKGLLDDYGRFNYKFEDNLLLEVVHPVYIEPPKAPTTEELLIESAVDTDFRLSMLEMGLV